jgi:hypothetical protein
VIYRIFNVFFPLWRNQTFCFWRYVSIFTYIDAMLLNLEAPVPQQTKRKFVNLSVFKNFIRFQIFQKTSKFQNFKNFKKIQIFHKISKFSSYTRKPFRIPGYINYVFEWYLHIDVYHSNFCSVFWHDLNEFHSSYTVSSLWYRQSF